jgi:histidine triad (HIT) family protein
MSDFYCDEVLSGKTPVNIVFESETILAFHHTRPSYTTHIVVIPKRHIASLLDITSEDGSLLVEMLKVIQSIATKIVQDTGACKIITNLGSYQESKHLHWHLISSETIRVNNDEH